jgi:hypothetical protein
MSGKIFLSWTYIKGKVHVDHSALKLAIIARECIPVTMAMYQQMDF